MTGPAGWVLFGGLVAANAFFVCAEFSLASLDRARVSSAAAQGSRRARSTLASVRELSLQLSGAQLGITLSSLLVGVVAEPVISDVLEPAADLTGLPAGVRHGIAAVVALLIATFVQMLLGELVPQNLAIARPQRMALAVAPLLRGFTAAGRPVIAVFNGTANQVVRFLGIQPQQELRAARTPAELSSLIDSSAQQGSLPSDVAALLRRSLTFADHTAGDVMTPRVHMNALRVSDTVADLLDLARSTGHSRFPVHPGDVDEIVGTVHVKHAFGVRPDRRADTPVRLLMRPPVRVPQSLECDDLLLTLRRRGLQLAVVVDEYGGTAGVVTLEDLLEELVGAVRDEYDLSETPDAVRLADGSWSVSGLLRKDELADRIGLRAPDGAYETVAGLVLVATGELPEAGDTAHIGDWTFTVTRMDGRRIDRVQVQPPTRRERTGAGADR